MKSSNRLKPKLIFSQLFFNILFVKLLNAAKNNKLREQIETPNTIAYKFIYNNENICRLIFKIMHKKIFPNYDH